MTDRISLKTAFLTKAGWADADILPITGDASSRSYQRLARGEARAILMDVPPDPDGSGCPPDATPQERARLGYNAQARLAGANLNAFTTLAETLRGAGLHAPEIYTADTSDGFALIEDFGDGLFARVIAEGADEAALYSGAIDALVRLHDASVPRPATSGYTLLDYDETAMHAEAALLVDWYWPFLHGTPTPDAIKESYHAAWDETLAGLSAPHTLVLRDYHAENLLWISDHHDTDGITDRVGIIDFQDGLYGHAAYDLVSLMEDARRDVSDAVHDSVIQRYINARTKNPDFDEASFLSDFAILAAQRNAKILGIFARLVTRDNKERYRQFMPRVRSHFARDLSRPQVAPLRNWVSENMPELLTP